MRNGKWKMEITNRGFTLLELLVVISIIGILSTVITANFIGAQTRARDAQRKANLQQMQAALELYRADQGSYPVSIPACGQAFSVGSTVYMQTIPCDPKNTGQFVYNYVLNGSAYSLVGCLENVEDSQKDAANVTAYCTGGSTNWSYTRTNP